MPSLNASDIITRLTTAKNIDTSRAAGHPFKLTALLRADVDADLAALIAAETATDPAEGARAGSSATRRAALTELERELRGGHRLIGGIDEDTITPAQRLQVFTSYGWEGGHLGEFTDDRTIGLARLAPTVTAAEAGNAAWLYPAARLTRIAAQLAIIDAQEGPATGADREAATRARDAALELAGDTLLRVRFFYCSASRDVDATPELTRIGYQPRREPGEGGGGEGEEPQPPTALVIGTATRTAADTITLDYVAGGGAGASTVEIQWRLSGESDFLHGVSAEVPQQVLQAEDFANGPVTFRTRASNAAGETFGPEVTVEL